MIDTTLTIEHIKARFSEWIIAFDPSMRCYWLLHWRYLELGWCRVDSMLRIEAVILDIRRRYAPYVRSWETAQGVALVFTASRAQ
ncbi:hypothetical protein GCM10023195_33620 [Actinoallomurus liliacearum]|uniref:Uncharacterized protein n=1 Tax=Actinoallomurus liliacearum TaxID=1080073 RepID=A0ABP8TJQ9_9ACTN